MIPHKSRRIIGLTGKPRASGDDPRKIYTDAEHAGVNPARAGMIPASLTFFSASWSKPRASGDDPGSWLRADGGPM